MKLIILSMILLGTINSYAAHCHQPKELPNRIYDFAVASLAKQCPNTVANQSLEVVKWSQDLWDREEYYTLQFKGPDQSNKSYYHFEVRVDGECYGNQNLSTKWIKTYKGCY